MKKVTLIILISLLLIDIATAASIQGKVYDFSLSRLNNVIVEINTIPAQRQIAQDGSYTFNVPRGNYTITVRNLENRTLALESITINEEGTYTLDIITFIDIEEEQELLNDTDIDLTTDIEGIEQKNNGWLVAIIIIVIILLAVFLYYKTKRKKQPEELEGDLTNKVLEIIKKEGGRTTQKELRKRLPYSEAKISLIITELESKGKLQKIKKGRSNVIILKKI